MRHWFQAEPGLHQNWMRDYDPTTGRYIQADPLGLVDGPSVYGYALQNPGRYVDPRGLQSIAADGPISLPGGGSVGNFLSGAGRIARVCTTASGAFVTFMFMPSQMADGTCEALGCGNSVFTETPPYIDPEGAEHILNGHGNPGDPDKSRFPADMTDDEIIDIVDGVANTGTIIPGAETTVPGGVVKVGTHSGIETEVIVGPDGRVHTGYPIGGPGVRLP